VALGIMEQLGIAGLLLVPLYFLGKWAVTKIINESIKRQEKVFEMLEAIHTSLNVEGHSFRLEDAIKRQTDIYKKIESVFSEDREMCKTLIDSQKRIASDEHWKNCPIDRCPNISQLRDALWRVESAQIDSSKSYEESRRKIEEKIDVIDFSMKGFANEFISTHQAILNGFVQARNQERDSS